MILHHETQHVSNCRFCHFLLIQVLQRVCREIPEDIPVIIDAKRAATDEAAEAYAHAFFSVYGVSMLVEADCCLPLLAVCLLPNGVCLLYPYRNMHLSGYFACFSAHLHQADCITLDPYFGENALLPFLKEKGKGIFVVCRSSNPRSADLQGLLVKDCLGEADGNEARMEVFMHVAHMCDSVRRQNGKHKCTSIQSHWAL